MGKIVSESGRFFTVGTKVFSEFVLVLKPKVHIVLWKFVLSTLK